MKGTGKKLTSAGGWDLTQDGEGGGKSQLLSPHNLYTSFMWKNACCCSDQLVAPCNGPAQGSHHPVQPSLAVKPLCHLLDTFAILLTQLHLQPSKQPAKEKEYQGGSDNA